jgi:hypothetical protein
MEKKLSSFAISRIEAISSIFFHVIDSILKASSAPLFLISCKAVHIGRSTGTHHAHCLASCIFLSELVNEM